MRTGARAAVASEDVPAVAANEVAKPMERRAAPAAPGAAMADCGGPDCGGPPCQQATLQLVVRHQAGAAHRIELVKLELLDAAGAVLTPLTVRVPSAWVGDRGYLAWDGRVDVGAEVRASYPLVVGDWSKVPAGAGAAASFQVQVTARVDGGPEVVATGASVGVMPMIVT
ncbi:MAG: hypothetical protein R2939_18695 [Kofleriaceae bacterium]